MHHGTIFSLICSLLFTSTYTNRFLFGIGCIYDHHADMRHYLKITWLLSTCPSTGRMKTILKNQSVDTIEKIKHHSEDINNHYEGPQRNSLDNFNHINVYLSLHGKKMKRLQVDKWWGNWKVLVTVWAICMFITWPKMLFLVSITRRDPFLLFSPSTLLFRRMGLCLNLNFLGEKNTPTGFR